MEALIKSLEGPNGGKSNNKEAPQEVVSNMQFSFLGNKLMLQLLCACTYYAAEWGTSSTCENCEDD